MQRLTAEQAQLAADNHNLIYYCLHRYNLPVDEYYSAAAVGLCEAAAAYDPAKGTKFSTFCVKTIVNRFAMQQRKERAKKRTAIVVSLQEPVKGTDKLRLYDVIPDEVNSIDDGINVAEINAKIAGLKERDREILRLRSQGLTTTEIGKRLDLSQATIVRDLQRLKRQLTSW